MSRQSNSRSSITGRFKFAPDIESDIAKAEKDVSLLRGSIVTLKQGASLGKDLAAQAGYDSNERNRITDLLRKTKDFSEECQTLRQDIRVAKESVRQVELNSLAGLDSDGDGEARKRATSKLVEFLAESPDIQTLLAHMPPAMNTSIQGVLAQGPNPSEDVVALQTLLETRNKKITDLEAMCRHHEREAQRAMQDLRRAQEHHENNKSALKRKIANPDGKDWKNEYLAESKFRNLKLDMQAEIDSQKKQIDSFKAANTNLKRTANDVEFQLRETQSELRKAKREHANETRMAENDLRVFENAVQAKRQVFADQNRRINELEKALTNKYNIITKRDDVIRTRDQEIQSLNEIISRQRKALVEKNLKIKKLEKASNHKDNIITKRDVTWNL
ncbi:hypothetical protein FPSE5266_06320 [Fusarium pseudograminearum]|nr:hypothetical protein FPSE5266_06320 [Fusarium pseudograminearum]